MTGAAGFDEAIGYNGWMVTKGQFTLASFFFVSGVVALALLDAGSIGSPVPTWFGIPIVACGAVGIIRGRFVPWLGYGYLATAVAILIWIMIMILSRS
jgi:hypothetical protein